MEEVWRHDETTVRDILTALNGQGDRQRAYTTVMTIVHRLYEKGLLERRRDGRVDVYRARSSREDYQRERAAAEVDALVGQFGDAALVQFAVQMRQLDPEQRRRLQRLARRDD